MIHIPNGVFDTTCNGYAKACQNFLSPIPNPNAQSTSKDAENNASNPYA